MIVVAKIGTRRSPTTTGEIDEARHRQVRAREVGRAAGRRPPRGRWSPPGAIAAGLPAARLSAATAPRDAVTLQAVSAVGQSRLMRVYDDALAAHGLVAGQVLLAPLDFIDPPAVPARPRARSAACSSSGVVPVVNENDAIADDEIRFGDNDRLAALVAHLVGADLLVLLTDTPGLLTADPRLDAVGVAHRGDRRGRPRARGAGRRAPASARGSGGMASKLAAAKIAAWSGVRAVIAGADRAGRAGRRGRRRARRRHGGAPARPAARRPASSGSRSPSAPRGTVVVDDGARRALARAAASRCCRPAWSA